MWEEEMNNSFANDEGKGDIRKRNLTDAENE